MELKVKNGEIISFTRAEIHASVNGFATVDTYTVSNPDLNEITIDKLKKIFNEKENLEEMLITTMEGQSFTKSYTSVKSIEMTLMEAGTVINILLVSKE